jgi:osmoprotectant transport system substrate-binding protein
MKSFVHSWRVRALTLSMLIILMTFPGCTNSPNNSSSSLLDGIQIKVGGKLDTEAQLLTKMYVLLLRHAGFTVIEKAQLGGNDVVQAAILSGEIDLYPEFTATGLTRLGLNTTHNPQQDYQNVKAAYENIYKIAWLDVAPLDDTYGICTLKNWAKQFHVSSISDLARFASSLTIATPPDGLNDPNVLHGLKPTYGFTFGGVIVLNGINGEEATFQAVQHGQAQVNICYTTSSLILKDNFVLLNDDKNSFPIYNPAPIVRDDTLKKAPQIAIVLNKLAPKLTTDVSTMLQGEVLSGMTVTDVATEWLKSQGLL